MNLKRLLCVASAIGVMVLGVLAPAGDGSAVAYAKEDNKTQENSETTETTETTEETETTENVDADEGDEVEEVVYPNHTHTFEWVAKMNESESADGTLNYMCTKCGKVWYFRTVPPLVAFSGDVAHRIKTAPRNSTVKVKTGLFITFKADVMEALADRQDVSLNVSFLDQEYKGNRQSFTIPAGEDTLSLVDENGYAGFLYLGGLYGLTMEVPMEVAEDGAGTAESTEEVQEQESGQTTADVTVQPADNVSQ